MRKILWVVAMDTAATEQVVAMAKNAGATAVCVRSSSQALPEAIRRFHDEDIKVLAWRWPAVDPGHGGHWFALDEARYVAETLIPAGLDGYIVDPESESGSPHDDWNHVTLKPLAQQFCHIIRSAADAGAIAFHFGVTSGCGYPVSRPNIPWSEFVAASDALYPQSYWRVDSKGQTKPANGGDPVTAFDKGIHVWTPISSGKPIIPMAGELDRIDPADLGAFARHASASGVSDLHVYAASVHVPAATYAALKAL